MNIIKKIIFLVIGCLFVFNNFVYAKVEPSRIAIGGIGMNNTKDYVRNIYGHPDKMESKTYTKAVGGNGSGGIFGFQIGDTQDIWYYGDSFKIIFGNGKVTEINSTAKNGLKTPDNISVGMKINALYEKYGQPDSTYKDESNGEVSFIYGSIYNNDLNYLHFNINNGIITEMRVAWYGNW